MEGLRNGGMERWKDGGMESLRDGGMKVHLEPQETPIRGGAPRPARLRGDLDLVLALQESKSNQKPA
ncbi:hypothetical protein EYF80_062472 [Liparis tanakae]|uniref:Uncharacterized protein n=1 Tax=Liparis tanakae TaxID=230148 RepID=A0A4Z2EF56_9TELE|nr:hypothetical protein EYF80_062472 [Liparis tanakae]